MTDHNKSITMEPIADPHVVSMAVGANSQGDDNVGNEEIEYEVHENKLNGVVVL